MKKNKIALSVSMLLLTVTFLSAQQLKEFEVKSPDNNITLRVSANEKLQWSVWLEFGEFFQRFYFVCKPQLFCLFCIVHGVDQLGVILLQLILIIMQRIS